MRGIASPAQLRMSFLRYALVTVPMILLLGILSGKASGSGYGNAWFDALIKPSFMPPGWVFGLAWTLLYIALGLALALILHARGARGRGLALGLFAAQLLLNFAWSPIFFALHKVDLAFLVLLAMLVLSMAVTLLFARIRPAAAWLMVPYVGWLVFAALLTWQVDALNPDAEQLVPQRGSTDILL
jgi:tryptophan-rich sensory protein